MVEGNCQVERRPSKRHFHRLFTRRRSAAKSAHSRPVRQNRDSRAASMSETAAAKTMTITPSSSGLTAREKRLLVDRLRALASVSIGRRPGRARGGTTGATPKGRWAWAGGGNLHEGRLGPMSDSATGIPRAQRRYLSAVACRHRWGGPSSFQASLLLRRLWSYATQPSGRQCGGSERRPHDSLTIRCEGASMNE